MTVILAIAVVLAAIALAVGYSFGQYTKHAHQLSEARDQRAHEIALRETMAVSERMKIEAQRRPATPTNEYDAVIARLRYHSRQSELAQQSIPLVQNLELPEQRREALMAALERQITSEMPQNADERYWTADGSRIL